MVIIVPADVLELKLTKPSACTVLTIKHLKCLLSFSDYQWFQRSFVDQKASFKMTDKVPQHLCHNGYQGLYSLSGKTSYRQISWSLEAARLDVAMVVSLWNLTGTSAALLPRYLPNFRAIGKVQTRISRLRDFARSCGKTSYSLVNRGPGWVSLNPGYFFFFWVALAKFLFWNNQNDLFHAMLDCLTLLMLGIYGDCAVCMLLVLVCVKTHWGRHKITAILI